MEQVITTKAGIRYRVPDFQKTIITPTGGMVAIHNITADGLDKIFSAMKANVMEYVRSKNPVEQTTEKEAESEVRPGIEVIKGGKEKKVGK